MLDSNPDLDTNPINFDFSCKQVEKDILESDYVFIYLGSDNSKGIKTDWKQGLRALGKIRSKNGGLQFKDNCTLSIDVVSIFPFSLDQHDFLERVPDIYVSFSKYPVIGVRQSRNNACQKVNERLNENTSALLTAIKNIYPGLEQDISVRAKDLAEYLSYKSKYSVSESKVTDEGYRFDIENNIVGSNEVYYGAPGTGKSYAIEQRVGGQHCVRTVFHPETSNSDFVGSIKPVTIRDERGSTSITYDYVPGPFIKSLVNALNNPESHHWLVIEEINRASAAAVFGEIFQLLDRDCSGQSEYSIDFTEPACQAYVESKTSSSMEKLYIPSNLSLIATMNSSDQGVAPMDTAFKRRWRFKYIPLNFNSGCTETDLTIYTDNEHPLTIDWKSFAEQINQTLTEIGVPEDRHLGPYFISRSDLIDIGSIFTGKIFIYLWDDVLRHGLRGYVFSSSIKTYGMLINHWESGKSVFCDSLIEKLHSRP